MPSVTETEMKRVRQRVGERQGGSKNCAYVMSQPVQKNCKSSS